MDGSNAGLFLLRGSRHWLSVWLHFWSCLEWNEHGVKLLFAGLILRLGSGLLFGSRFDACNVAVFSNLSKRSNDGHLEPTNTVLN